MLILNHIFTFLRHWLHGLHDWTVSEHVGFYL